MKISNHFTSSIKAMLLVVAIACATQSATAQINELPPLQPNEKGHKTVYPQYFFDALETAGGIEWRDGAWRITEAGRQLL